MPSKKKKTLVIVESPAKAKTIEKYLGSNFSVSASMGHLIDLPKSRIAISVENGFEPEYITVRGKAKILKELQTLANKSDNVLLASDNDREGEAIAYHLMNALRKKNPKLNIERIVFNEITPKAIREAVDHPGAIDEAKVKAQKARRVLDRLVGYNLSPILWKKVKNGLSAGRVQSVALSLICKREEGVESFIPEEYWTLDAELKKGKSTFLTQLVEVKGEKPELAQEGDVLKLVELLEGKDFLVKEIKKTEKTLKPKAPFTTSKLQQAAANRLGFTSKKTMQIAQQLYEGINIGSSRIGLITYMRTDSTRISDTAMGEVRDFLEKEYPKDIPTEPNVYSMGKRAQDAHEAIRPTMPTYTPDYVKEYLTKDQFKLYSIIWERFISSQMNNARSVTTSISFEVGDALFRSASTKIVDKGFHKVLKLLASKEKSKALPAMKEGDVFKDPVYVPEQHFTTGPTRYTDATIVKALEEKGIGRPSTYAPIISVLLDRYYVVRKNKQLQPTVLGKIINEMLVSSFPDILNVDFTAGMEVKLDNVEDNKQDWAEMIGGFYGPFKSQVDTVIDNLESYKGVMDEKTEYNCEKCGRPMVKKLGRFGYFLACSGFPECMSTQSIPLGECPKPDCDGKIVARRKSGGRGKEFYGCSKYPECDFITHYKPTSQKCPKCDYFLVEKTDKKKGTYKGCINPDCDFLHDDHEEEIPEGALG